MSDVEVDDDPCAGSPTTNLGLRIGAIFIILVTSLFGTLFPIASKRIPVLRRAVPGVVFEFAKYFGSGVILATGFIHLLEPAADEELSEGNTISAGGCISDKWGLYPFAFGICLVSLFFTFVLHLVAFRIGTERLQEMGLSANTGGHDHPHAGGHHVHPEVASSTESSEQALEKGVAAPDSVDGASFADAQERSPLIAQILGVATLEFGVIFHSIIIGLTLAVTGSDEFNILFIVIIFHQMFEGLGLGTRLAFLNLPPKYNWVPFVSAVVYSIVTPLGMAIGLGVREGLSMSSGSASVAAGVLDSISAGILIYTATVELISHEFILNKAYLTCSWGKLWFSLTSFGFGAGIMALLGKWA
ncbi:Zinc/iron permease [Leucosporidium creatinivorum]|uniref:Zinc/iron permease n=1 Tax=Leucosporidium creatinivorum TaxID=106004 RepID=A0A1Y2FL46_9BASI|nr:Zinc/iron permease [Leucosporidium creatinivorum]